MSETRPNVLVVDDDRQLQRALGSILATRNYEVTFAESGEQALQLAMDVPPDLVVLDLALPGKDGMQVCREMRTWLTAPILVLSVRSDPREKIQALDLGADDYMSKPFVAGELLARLRALLRRTNGPGMPVDPIVHARNLELDLARRRVLRAGEEIRLTRTEFEILALLMRHADRVVTSHAILREVWGPEYVDDVMTLRVHIGNLRKKIGNRCVTTEPGVGYMFVSEI